MKKIIYLCAMLMLSMNMMAQIDPHDQNWDTLFFDDFSQARTWSNKWYDRSDESSALWECYSWANWDSGVTTGDRQHQAYQPSQAVFSADSTMKLIGTLHSQNSMLCPDDYQPAPLPHKCDSLPFQHQEIHYYSGMIETKNHVGFGYYEIECKMPTRVGASSSFWFWSAQGGTYNEIDVFEHCKSLCENKLERRTVSGIWYNPNGTGVEGAVRYHENKYDLSENTTLNNYHTFSCLWLPDKVTWYIDGIQVNEEIEHGHIPQFPMRLKITHKQDNYSREGENGPWLDVTDTMTVNYVKAFRLKTDCETDTSIRTLADFAGFYYSVKRSIAMGSPTGTLTIPNNACFTMRAVNSITIDGGFELPVGASMTLITQMCPECLSTKTQLLDDTPD